MFVLSMGMYIAVREWESSGNRLDTRLDNALQLLQLERALSGAYPQTFLNRKENKRYVFFIGEEHKLIWVSTVSPGRQGGMTVWQLSPDKDHKDGLEIRTAPAFGGDPRPNLEKAKPIQVFTNYKLTFEYLYVDANLKADTKWHKEWLGEKRQGLPNAVRLRLEKDNDTPENMIEIIAIIHAFEHESLQRVKPQ
jgi:general secretion pathway protein J